jgi:hypothetical protein
MMTSILFCKSCEKIIKNNEIHYCERCKSPRPIESIKLSNPIIYKKIFNSKWFINDISSHHDSNT